MISSDRPISSYGVLLKALDDTLAFGEFSNDMRKSAEIALELCNLVRTELDPKQLAAVEAATRFWNDEGLEQERLHYLQKLSARMDRNRNSVANSPREMVLDRLVFCALNAKTGLSVLAGEFIAELAETLNIAAKDAWNAFSRHLPLRRED